jgi:hypothetical protein
MNAKSLTVTGEHHEVVEFKEFESLPCAGLNGGNPAQQHGTASPEYQRSKNRSLVVGASGLSHQDTRRANHRD